MLSQKVKMPVTEQNSTTKIASFNEKILQKKSVSKPELLHLKNLCTQAMDIFECFQNNKSRF